MSPYIKSPLNYIGGKYKLLPQILPLFPSNINCFVDLFAGGCNVGINVQAKQINCNDNLSYLIDLYEVFQRYSPEHILDCINSRIEQYSLSLTNQAGFLQLRKRYNTSREPLDLFVLIAYSFNHQIRFNNSHEYNNPFGAQRSSFNESMKQNLIRFVTRLHKIRVNFTCKNFTDVDFSRLSTTDMVYCDPPYLITTGTYNDGKRGFIGWGNNEEIALLKILDSLNARNVRFALSNVLSHKGKNNQILQDWVTENQYFVNELAMNYSNSNYHTKNRDPYSSIEVLITNYPPEKAQQERFDF